MIRHALELILALVIAAFVSGVCGCAVDEASTTDAGAIYQQKYDMEYVRGQLDRLQPGMGKAEVVILLGSPAEEQASKWIYRPNRSALIVPAEALVVRFEQGRYVSHRFEPIILGERLGDS